MKRKLNIRKETIASLSNQEQTNLKGGFDPRETFPCITEDNMCTKDTRIDYTCHYCISNDCGISKIACEY